MASSFINVVIKALEDVFYSISVDTERDVHYSHKSIMGDKLNFDELSIDSNNLDTYVENNSFRNKIKHSLKKKIGFSSDRLCKFILFFILLVQSNQLD